jgi:hypothetical protein
MPGTTPLEVYDKIDTVLKKLYLCTAKSQIDSVFDEAAITEPKEKINLLRKCMEVENVYGTPEKISDEDEYEFECAVFEEGTWRMLN